MIDFDLVAFGEVALDVMLLGVDRFPRRWSDLGRMKRGGIFPAGSAGYVAQCFSKLGGRAAVVGRIGSDSVGRFVVEGFQQCGVYTQHLVIDKHAETEVSTVVMYVDGNKSSVVSDILPLNLRQLSRKPLTGAGAFHVGGYLLYPELWRKRVLPWFNFAKREGALISVDPQMSATGEWSEPFNGILEHVDLLLLDEEEAKKISRRKRVIDAIEALLKAGSRVVAVKAGRKGCIVGGDGRIRTIRPYETRPICTIGAGDAFDAAFIYGSLRAWNLSKIGQFANVVAAISTRTIGCMEAIPRAAVARKISESYYSRD